MTSNKILITGGSGYVGVELIKKLIKNNYKIINIDNNLFGNFFIKNKNVTNFNLDIKFINKVDISSVNTCIHLASIANDPMADLDHGLSWETSALGTKLLLDHLIKNNVKKIIYASSGSVYGVKKNNLSVTEEEKLEPISTYNKVKMITEKVLESYKDKIEIIILRPATICGLSERMRLDLTVNMLTFHSLKKKKIIVYGGKQKRPNIHIDDMIDAYIFFLNKKIKFGIFNVGFENMSIIQIAKLISKETGGLVKVKKEISDPRSYNLNSNKIISIGFKPKKTILNAIREFKYHYENGKFKDKPNFHSISWLKKKL
jgi:nucleoside-diphosphate-sugar epimerase